MPNFDRLASLSKKMKDVRVVVSPGGGQEGTDGSTDAATVTAAPSSLPAASLPADAPAKPAAAAGPASASAPGTNGEVLGEIRDVLRELVTEIRAARTGGLPLSGGVPNVALDDVRAQLEMQGEQLAEILAVLKKK